MKKIIISLFSLLCLTAGSLQFVNAQEEEEAGNISLDVNMDLVSRYLWRGLMLDPAPNVQPYASLNVGDFSFGAWGSYSLTNYYAEADIFASYSVGDLTFTVTDYFTALDSASDFRYLNWKKDTTLHTLEGMISWTVSEKIPLRLSVGTMFYGYDLNDDGNPYYSTYLEAAYPISIGENTLEFVAGGTPANGYYHDKAALVNIGCKASRDIKINENFSMPLSLTLSVNPADKRAFIVAALTF